MRLDNIRGMARVDKGNMLDLLVSFPKQCEDALFIAERARIKAPYGKKYSNVVFTGLGGSAIGADIVKNYLSGEIRIPVFVNRDYTLPEFVNKNSLIFAVSYSGNTEETLSAYSIAKKRKADTVVITSGGKLSSEAAKNKDVSIAIPTGYPPRCALGYSFIPAVSALSRLGLIKEKTNEIKSASRHLRNLEKRALGPGVNRGNISKEIAKRLYKRFPVFYASGGLESVLVRWRGQFAENAKTLASTHVFPEMNHNEVVGWQNPRFLLLEFTAVILKDAGDHPRVKRRMDITKRILRSEKFNVLEVESRGRTLLERMLSLIYIGDFASFYLAILNGTDPTPVERIAYLKKELGK